MHSFVVLSAALAIALGLATLAVKPREEKGWVIPAFAAFLIASAFVEFVFTFVVLKTQGTTQGIFALLILGFGGIPHVIALLVVTVALFRAPPTRLRAFAFGLGLLGPALIWIGLLFFIPDTRHA